MAGKYRLRGGAGGADLRRGYAWARARLGVGAGRSGPAALRAHRGDAGPIRAGAGQGVVAAVAESVGVGVGGDLARGHAAGADHQSSGLAGKTEEIGGGSVVYEWRERIDDVVAAPEGMPTLDGKARRRGWRCHTGPRRWYDLTVYLGLDRDNWLIVVWECQVWDGTAYVDQMRSSSRPYGWKPAAVTGGKFAREAAMRALTLREVTGYSSWGSVLPGVGGRG